MYVYIYMIRLCGSTCVDNYLKIYVHVLPFEFLGKRWCQRVMILIEGSLEVKLPTIGTDEKAEVGRVREEKRREEMRREEKRTRTSQRRERVRRQEMQVREKVGQSRNTLFFQWFVAPEGRKIGSLKQRVRSRLGRWEIKNCAPLWREAHFEGKMRKMHKVCRPLWREAHFEVKTDKTHQHRSTFGRWDVQKVHGVVARSTCPSQNVKNTTGSPKVDVEASFCVAKREGSVALLKTMAGVGRFKKICKDAFRVAGAVQETCSSEMRWFPEKGCILEHQIFRFAEMILRDRCSTSHDLASLFRGRRSSLDRWSSVETEWWGCQLCTQLSIFEGSLAALLRFWFLMLTTSKMEEVSQFCFVFDVVKLENCGRLAELLRFWCCQLQKWRKSRRMLAGRQIDRWQLQLQLWLRLHLQLQLHYITLQYATPH